MQKKKYCHKFRRVGKTSRQYTIQKIKITNILDQQYWQNASFGFQEKIKIRKCQI